MGNVTWGIIIVGLFFIAANFVISIVEIIEKKIRRTYAKIKNRHTA